MRKIITTTFVTMDGVMQAPGGPQEDTSGGFAYGGWQAGWDDDITGKVIEEFMTIPFEMLLGRRTYEIFAGYWPDHPEIELIAKPFNSTKKYVVSHESIPLPWNNSELVTGDVVAEIQKLKKLDGPDLWVWGSGNLIQTLLKNNLIDRMHIWIHPVTIGTGKKLFADGTQPKQFKLVDSKISTRGVIFATYESDGELKTGSMVD
ncbi:MAG: dihydrofolate reductase family protein [Patescibacteria group bacterium]